MTVRQAAFPWLFVVACTTVARGGVSLPADFSSTQGANGIYYEAIGDSRSINTLNPAAPGTSSLDFNPAVAYPPDPARPTYNYQSGYPYVQLDADNNLMIVHPGTGGFEFGSGTANLGLSIRVQAPSPGLYSIVGDFARDNINVGAGDGVDVLVVDEADLDHPLFHAAISSNHAVDPSNPFAGTGVATFSLQATLAAGESLRFIVFSDDQGQDGTFDATAFRVAIAQVPEPASAALFALGAAAIAVARWRRRRWGATTA
jgi:hypothetical protein